MEMNMLICNKCFTPLYRGKRPYYITQCGHISCQTCLQQFEKQCPQCQRIGTISLALEEPLIPKLTPFFHTSIAETMEMLLKVDSFRNNQFKILMQRFQELDKKYEVLKTRYWLDRRNLRALTEKYVTSKKANEKLEKKLLFIQMGNKETPRSRIEMPMTDSGIFSNQSNTGYSLASSMNFMNSAGITPPIRTPEKKFYRTADGFRIPVNRKLPAKSVASSMLS
ncbi:PREDICTED: uncharacterized protein LOC108688509 [Atta colombica]|nr:PREDICTED: uncharacterized protein LOC108688509 [Atta colombica]